MGRSWAVVIPSDSEVSSDLSVAALLKAHPDMDRARIHIVTKAIDPSGARGALKGVTFVRDLSEFSFARRVNAGVSACNGLDVIVMGDDVELLTDGGFDLLAGEGALRILSASVRGRIGPWWQGDGENHVEVPFLSFVCVYIPRIILDSVGPLDDGFPGYGYEDTDYCLRTRRAGFSCGVSGRVTVEHSVRIPSAFVSFHQKDIATMEATAKAAFSEKWKRRST